MGDPSKIELSEAEMDAFDAKRGEAMSTLGEGEWAKASDLFTEAIKINSTSAAMFAKRGNCYIKLKKPNACIRDCTRAIELNPDNASAYKFRGRANR
jgi:suppressor of tumorigenicity protein 13